MTVSSATRGTAPREYRLMSVPSDSAANTVTPLPSAISPVRRDRCLPPRFESAPVTRYPIDRRGDHCLGASQIDKPLDERMLVGVASDEIQVADYQQRGRLVLANAIRRSS